MNDSNSLVIDAFWADTKPFPSEIAKNSPAGKFLYENYSGEATHLGWMDIIQLQEIIKSKKVSLLVIKNLDLLGKVASMVGCVQACNCYVYKNHLILRSVPKDGFSKDYIPIFDTLMFGGWSFSEDDDEIPVRAQVYLSQLAFKTKINVTYSNSKVKVTAYFEDTPYPKLRCEKIQ